MKASGQSPRGFIICEIREICGRLLPYGFGGVALI